MSPADAAVSERAFRVAGRPCRWHYGGAGPNSSAVVASGQDGDRLARVDHADLDLLAGEPKRWLRKTASARGSLAVAAIVNHEDGWQLCRDELTEESTLFRDPGT